MFGDILDSLLRKKPGMIPFGVPRLKGDQSQGTLSYYSDVQVQRSVLRSVSLKLT